MAKEKNSFVLYCDLVHTFRKLSDEQAGKLFKHILEYVNDTNPTLEDALLDIVFEPIKQSLKRDLLKYERTCKRNSENGSKGGRPKKPTETEKTHSVILEPKKADSDIDSDSENDTDIDIDNESENKASKQVPSWDEFKKWGDNKLIGLGKEPRLYEYDMKARYEAWVENGWQDSTGKEIERWKAKLTNTVPYLKVFEPQAKENETIRIPL
jgi:hypothetical protein